MVAYLELPRSRMNIMKDPIRRKAIVVLVVIFALVIAVLIGALVSWST